MTRHPACMKSLTIHKQLYHWQVVAAASTMNLTASWNLAHRLCSWGTTYYQLRRLTAGCLSLLPCASLQSSPVGLQFEGRGRCWLPLLGTVTRPRASVAQTYPQLQQSQEEGSGSLTADAGLGSSMLRKVKRLS